MTKKRSFFLIFILLFSSITIFDDAYGHPMFNSDEKFEAGYRVQIATAPEFPQIGEPSQFLVRVTNADYEEVDRFTMGIRVFFNDQQVDTILPRSIEGGHGNFEHIWRNQGNHVVKIDLYDIEESQGVVTYTFNIGTQSPYGYVFFATITVGALCFIGIIAYVYLPKVFKKSKL